MRARQLFEMWDLPTLGRMNAQAATRPPTERETTRHCSFAGDADTGIVLHSAKQRSTLFLQPGDPSTNFLQQWGAAQTDEERDHLVEGYFNTRTESLLAERRRRAKRIVNRLVDLPTL